jgi:uncharacterized protein YktB (UPF0637 family)
MNLNPLLKIKKEINPHRSLKHHVKMSPNHRRKQKLLNSRLRKNNRRNAASECFSPKKKELNIDQMKNRIRMKELKMGKKIIIKMTMTRNSLINRMVHNRMMKKMNRKNRKTQREDT